MNEFNRGSFGEHAVMLCQVCMNSHHEGKKEVFGQDARTGAYVRRICPLCMCLDCVQLNNDPIRSQIRPKMMGQTLQSTYNLNVDHHEPGKLPTKRNIHIKAPGPLNVPEAMKAIGDLLGLQAPGQQTRHALPQAVGCGCGKNATSRCIACEKPLCMKCLKNHEC